MVMRFIDGANLMQLAQQRGGRLPEADVLRYIAEVGEALSVLHASGILHRDVKPSNIIVNRSGHAVLVDFGAARAFVPDLTMTHSVVLTPGFAPPEQFQPRARRGPTTDIYALAATCYYLLTANLPDIMDDGRLDDPHLSPRLRAALEHALAYTPAARPQTVAAFLAELQGRAAVPLTPAKQVSPMAPTLPNPPQPATPPDATEVDRQYQRNPVGDETIMEGGQQRNLVADETFVERSQQRGYTPPPMYPLPADAEKNVIVRPRQQSIVLPSILVSIGVLLLLGVLASLLLGGRGSAVSSGTVTPVVALTTSTSLLAAATQTPVVIAIVSPTDTPLPTATPIPPSPTSAPTDTPVPPTPVLPTDTAVPPNPGNDPSKVSTYTVKGGDTFYSIAAQYNVNTGQLLAANNAVLKNTNDIQVGQTLNIPAPSYSPPSVQWTVETGENLTRIINRLQATDTNIDKIAAANPCQQNIHGVCDGGSTTYPGDTIIIPLH